MFFCMIAIVGMAIPPIMVLVIPIILIISLFMRIFGIFDDDLEYSPRSFSYFAIAVLALGSIVDMLIIIPLIAYVLYVLICISEDIGNTFFIFIPIRYLWIDIKGVFVFWGTIICLALTVIQIVLIPVGFMLLLIAFQEAPSMTWEDLLIIKFMSLVFDD